MLWGFPAVVVVSSDSDLTLSSCVGFKTGAQNLALFPGLSHFYMRLVHTKYEHKQKFEKRERSGTISHVR